MSLEADTTQNSFEEYAEITGYFRHFGLKRDPFGIEEKESSLYLLPNWEQQIDLMLHYIRHENVLLTLTGPKGIGKTTLINFFLLEAIHGFSPTETAVQSDLVPGEFLVQLGDTTRTCQIVADNALNPEQIIEVMAGAFDISTEHFSGNFEDQADALLVSLQHCKQSCVLLIDEAQELPDATIDLLLYMLSQQSESQHRLHVVLIGESSLKKRLAKIGKTKEYQELIHSIDLDPLNVSQTEYYLKHRFAAAGLQDEMLFSNGLINKIYKISGGVPKMINQLARQSLINMLKKKKFSSLGAIFKPYKKTFIGGGFLLASFAIILLYLGQDIKSKPQQTTAPIAQQPLQRESQKNIAPTPAPSAPIVQPPLPVASQQTSATMVQQPLQTEPQKTIPLAAATPSAPIAQQPLPVLPQQTNTPMVQQPLQTEPQKTIPPTPPAPSAPIVQQPLPVAPQTNVPPQIQAPTPPPRTGSIVESSSLIEPDSGMTSTSEVQAPLVRSSQKPLVGLKKKEAEKEVAQKPTHVPPKKSSTRQISAKSESTSNHYTKQLAQKNPSHYTLKLTDGYSKAAINALMTRYKLGSNAAYYQSSETSKYVLVYGEYANAETAKRAIALLPPSLQQLEPEPYRISVVQKTIHSAQADE